MKMLIQKDIKLISGFVPAAEPVDADFFEEIAIDAGRNEAVIGKIEESQGRSYLLATEEDLEHRYKSPKQRFFTFKEGILKEVVNAVFFEKKKKILALEHYDKSPAVNSFLISQGEGSLSAWLGSDLRLKLKYRLETEQRNGVAATTLNIQGRVLTLPVANALSFLKDLESYAIKCYDNTTRHRQNIEQLQEVTDIKSYDFTTEYPAKIIISLPN